MSDIQLSVIVSLISLASDSFDESLQSFVLMALVTVVTHVSNGSWLMRPAVVHTIFVMEWAFFNLRECNDDVVGSCKVEIAKVSNGPVSEVVGGSSASVQINMNFALFVTFDATVWVIDHTPLIHTCFRKVLVDEFPLIVSSQDSEISPVRKAFFHLESWIEVLIKIFENVVCKVIATVLRKVGRPCQNFIYSNGGTIEFWPGF